MSEQILCCFSYPFVLEPWRCRFGQGLWLRNNNGIGFRLRFEFLFLTRTNGNMFEVRHRYTIIRLSDYPCGIGLPRCSSLTALIGGITSSLNVPFLSSIAAIVSPC